MITNSILAALILYAIGTAFALVIWGYVLGRRHWLAAIALASVWMASVPAMIAWVYLDMGMNINGWLRRG